MIICFYYTIFLLKFIIVRYWFLMAEKPLPRPVQSSQQLSRDIIRDRIVLAGKLLLCCVENSHIVGIQRFSRKLRAEKEFLESLLDDGGDIKEQHLNSTNLLYLEAIKFICDCSQSISAVLQHFSYVLPTGEGHSILVDVVVNKGAHWIKVITRKRSAILRKWLGQGQYDDRCITETARDFIEASQQNSQQGNKNPAVVFVFFDGIIKDVSYALTRMGVIVIGQEFNEDDTNQTDSPLETVQMMKGITTDGNHMKQELIKVLHVAPPTRISLDVSSMIAWVSGLTHGGAMLHYQDHIIEEQAKLQRKNPLWPIFLETTKGVMLCACSTAVKDFKNIVSVIGGSDEQKRAEELLARVQVVPDNTSSRFKQLPTTSRISNRAKIIFGTADALNIPILTANEGFVRSVKQQGIVCDVILHHPCALSEKKVIVSAEQPPCKNT